MLSTRRPSTRKLWAGVTKSVIPSPNSQHVVGEGQALLVTPAQSLRTNEWHTPMTLVGRDSSVCIATR